MATFNYALLCGILDHHAGQMRYTCNTDLPGLAGCWNDLTEALNSMGEHGAELCGVIPYHGSLDAFVEMIFKVENSN